VREPIFLAERHTWHRDEIVLLRSVLPADDARRWLLQWRREAVRGYDDDPVCPSARRFHF